MSGQVLPFKRSDDPWRLSADEEEGPEPELRVSIHGKTEVDLGSIGSPKYKDSKGHHEQINVKLPGWLVDNINALMGLQLPHTSRNHWVIDSLAKMAKAWADHLEHAPISEDLALRQAIAEMEAIQEREAERERWANGLRDTFDRLYRSENYIDLERALDSARVRLTEVGSDNVQGRLAGEQITHYTRLLAGWKAEQKPRR